MKRVNLHKDGIDVAVTLEPSQFRRSARNEMSGWRDWSITCFACIIVCCGAPVARRSLFSSEILFPLVRPPHEAAN